MEGQNWLHWPADKAGQSNSNSTLPKHSNNVVTNHVMETTNGQVNMDIKTYANIRADVKMIQKMCFERSIYLGLSRILPKKWKELPKQLNRNTAVAEWRAGGGSVATLRKNDKWPDFLVKSQMLSYNGETNLDFLMGFPRFFQMYFNL